MQTELFGTEVAQQPAERVLMALNPQYYDLIWRGRKRHEFRRRYVSGRPTRWFVYLTAPVSRLAAMIALDTAIVDTPRRIADIAEQALPGNGVSVLDYLQGRDRGFAMPIMTVQEHAGFSTEQLAAWLGSFHPPQGYTLVNRQPALTRICDELVSSPVVRQMTVHPPAP